MKIVTKYNIGDTVFIATDNIEPIEITSININVLKHTTLIKYNSCGYFLIPEDLIYNSKEKAVEAKKQEQTIVDKLLKESE